MLLSYTKGLLKLRSGPRLIKSVAVSWAKSHPRVELVYDASGKVIDFVDREQPPTDDEAVAAADDSPEVRKIDDEIVQAIQKRMDEMERNLWADEPHQLK